MGCTNSSLMTKSGTGNDKKTKCLNDEVKKYMPSVVDLADEHIEKSESMTGTRREYVKGEDGVQVTSNRKKAKEATIKLIRKFEFESNKQIQNPEETEDEVALEEKLGVIRGNLPVVTEISTPFGKRPVCYADYTASGRQLACIEEYLNNVVAPMFANTHTESSATGLQTTHFREEARALIKKSLGGVDALHHLIFTGSGTTGAIHKLICLLGMELPNHLRVCVEKSIPREQRPLVIVSYCEHHSNELMWRENYAGDVEIVGADENGECSIEEVRAILEKEKIRAEKAAKEAQENGFPTPPKRKIIASLSAGSNVTGLRTNPFPIAALCHEYGAISCWDYAAAGPYVDINMMGDPNIENSYLDAIYLSTHKFVGGPGTPGILLARKDLFSIEIPTIPGGGTVAMVWIGKGHERNAIYEKDLAHREEAGTPDIIGAIRAGLVFRVRNLIGVKNIELLEGKYASLAVQRLKKLPNMWIMGDDRKNITSEHGRLSITSFNINFHPPQDLVQKFNIPQETVDQLKARVIHPHFVCTLLNDVYGIQSRSGCSCAGPLGMLLFKKYFEGGLEPLVIENARKGFHAYKPGWARVNFNYFITYEEFDFILQAIEQVAKHGWKLLPLYALCLRTGQFFYNNKYDRFDGIRTLKEFNFTSSNEGVEWFEMPTSKLSNQEILDQAMELYDHAPKMIRNILYRFRDLRRNDVKIAGELEQYRFFVLGSEILPFLGISKDELYQANEDARHADPEQNPKIVAFPKHEKANPMYTFGRPRG